MKTIRNDIVKALIPLTMSFIFGICGCLFCLYPYVEFSNKEIQLEQQTAKTAFETRTESIQPQLESIKEEIKLKSSQGGINLHLQYIPYPEVIEVLVSEGYNIEVHTNDGLGYSELSWEFAEEEKVGKLKIMD